MVQIKKQFRQLIDNKIFDLARQQGIKNGEIYNTNPQVINLIIDAFFIAIIEEIETEELFKMVGNLLEENQEKEG